MDRQAEKHHSKVRGVGGSEGGLQEKKKRGGDFLKMKQLSVLKAQWKIINHVTRGDL